LSAPDADSESQTRQIIWSFLFRLSFRVVLLFGILVFLILDVSPYFGPSRDAFVRAVLFVAAFSVAIFAILSNTLRSRALARKIEILREKRASRGRPPTP